MSSIEQLLPKSNLGWKGEKPPKFDLGSTSTIHYQSSLNDNPKFTSYLRPYLRTLKPTKLAR